MGWGQSLLSVSLQIFFTWTGDWFKRSTPGSRQRQATSNLASCTATAFSGQVGPIWFTDCNWSKTRVVFWERSLRFNSCGFPKPIMATLFSLGFAAPTPIQAERRAEGGGWEVELGGWIEVGVGSRVAWLGWAVMARSPFRGFHTIGGFVSSQPSPSFPEFEDIQRCVSQVSPNANTVLPHSEGLSLWTGNLLAPDPITFLEMQAKSGFRRQLTIGYPEGNSRVATCCTRLHIGHVGIVRSHSGIWQVCLNILVCFIGVECSPLLDSLLQGIWSHAAEDVSFWRTLKMPLMRGRKETRSSRPFMPMRVRRRGPKFLGTSGGFWERLSLLGAHGAGSDRPTSGQWPPRRATS